MELKDAQMIDVFDRSPSKVVKKRTKRETKIGAEKGASEVNQMKQFWNEQNGNRDWQPIDDNEV